MYFMLLYLDCISRIKKSTFGARIFLPRLFFFGFMYLALCVSKMKFSEWHFDSFNVKQHVHIYYYCIHWMLMLACYKFMQFHRFHPSLLNDENLWKKIIQSFFPISSTKKKETHNGNKHRMKWRQMEFQMFAEFGELVEFESEIPK